MIMSVKKNIMTKGRQKIGGGVWRAEIIIHYYLEANVNSITFCISAIKTQMPDSYIYFMFLWILELFLGRPTFLI